MSLQHRVNMIDEPASGQTGGEVVRFAATSRCIGDMYAVEESTVTGWRDD